MDVFTAKGIYSTHMVPPVLFCRNCRAVIAPKNGQTRIVCRCGKVYTLMAEGVPIKKVSVPGG